MHIFFHFFLYLTLPCFLFSEEQHPLSLTSAPSFVPCDFKESVQRHGKSLPTYQYYTERKSKYTTFFEESFSIFKDLFDNFQNSFESQTDAHKIPKIVHQIWLGSPLPEKYHKIIQTWTQWYGWEYKLWTETEAEALCLYNQSLFDRSKNYGEKADILRLEILYNLGGLYIDIDFECLNPAFFDLVHDHLDFYAGIEPLEHGGLKICNAIIASAPGHPLLYECIINLQENYKKNKKRTAIEKCGPNYVTAIINKYLRHSHETKDAFFPTTYFYPTSKLEVQNGSLFVFPESVAQHYWDGNWITQ